MLKNKKKISLSLALTLPTLSTFASIPLISTSCSKQETVFDSPYQINDQNLQNGILKIPEGIETFKITRDWGENIEERILFRIQSIKKIVFPKSIKDVDIVWPPFGNEFMGFFWNGDQFEKNPHNVKLNNFTLLTPSWPSNELVVPLSENYNFYDCAPIQQLDLSYCSNVSDLSQVFPLHPDNLDWGMFRNGSKNPAIIWPQECNIKKGVSPVWYESTNPIYIEFPSSIEFFDDIKVPKGFYNRTQLNAFISFQKNSKLTKLFDEKKHPNWINENSFGQAYIDRVDNVCYSYNFKKLDLSNCINLSLEEYTKWFKVAYPFFVLGNWSSQYPVNNESSYDRTRLIPPPCMNGKIIPSSLEGKLIEVLDL